MMLVKTRALVLFVLLCLITLDISAAEKHDRPRKEGILLVTFGSSEKTAQVSFENIDRKVKEAYPGIPVRWAYTSHIIRERFAEKGTYLDSPEVALAKMQDENFTHVAVQSLHTIAGAEFQELYRAVAAFEMMEGFEKVVLGYPLMNTQKDMEDVAAAVIASIPAERSKEDAVLLVGHGTHHPSNVFYAALMFQLQLDDPNIFVGTVEGYPKVNLLKQELLKKNIRKAYLLPFMSVAGDHAKNDMAGDKKDSWVSILTEAGIKCVPVLKGTAEFDEYVAIWVDHVGKSLRQLGEGSIH